MPRQYNRPSLEDRFWKKIGKEGPVHPELGTRCWEWTAARTNLGYGQFRDGKTRKASRVAWEIAVGPIPTGVCVLHRCDNPPCVNPAHLFLGTKRENTLDMFAKGRSNTPRGARHGTHTKPENYPRGQAKALAKLTDANVLAMREDYAKGALQSELAARFGVDNSVVSRAINRRTWAHL